MNMKTAMRQNPFLWAARGLAIAVTLFVSMFAVDVFRAGHSLGAIVIELVIHLAPSLLFLFVLWVTWKRARYAAIGYLLIAALFTVFFRTYRSVEMLLLFTVPLLLISFFFFMASKKEAPPAAA